MDVALCWMLPAVRGSKDVDEKLQKGAQGMGHLCQVLGRREDVQAAMDDAGIVAAENCEIVDGACLLEEAVRELVSEGTDEIALLEAVAYAEPQCGQKHVFAVFSGHRVDLARPIPLLAGKLRVTAWSRCLEEPCGFWEVAWLGPVV